MSSWIKFYKDSDKVENPFLMLNDNGGKGLFLIGDNSHRIMLGGGNNSNRQFRMRGGQSYPSFYIPVKYPLTHQPKRKMFYD